MDNTKKRKKTVGGLVSLVVGSAMAFQGFYGVSAAPSVAPNYCEDPTATYTQEVPTDTPEIPTDTPEVPTDTPEVPTNTPWPACTENFANTLDESQCSTAGSGYLWAEAYCTCQIDPTDTPEVPTDTPEVPTLTPTDKEWEKSSLEFVLGCDATCEQVKAKACNSGDGDMTGPVAWEIWYAASGNPKNGSQVPGTGGTLGPLNSGACTWLTHSPVISGWNYMFKAYQEAGHPGAGVLWSESCSAVCDVTDTPTPRVPTNTPTDTATPTDTYTPTVTDTATPTDTHTPGPSPTNTNTPRVSLTPSLTPSVTASLTATPYNTPPGPTKTPKKTEDTGFIPAIAECQGLEAAVASEVSLANSVPTILYGIEMVMGLALAGVGGVVYKKREQ